MGLRGRFPSAAMISIIAVLDSISTRKLTIIARPPVALGRALQGRLGVEAAQEHFQRHRRPLEVLAQELQVRAVLGDPGDRQLDRTQRFGHEDAQRLFRAPGLGILGPRVANLSRQPQQAVDDRTDHAALGRLPAKARERLRGRSDQAAQLDLSAERTHVWDNCSRTGVRYASRRVNVRGGESTIRAQRREQRTMSPTSPYGAKILQRLAASDSASAPGWVRK